MIDEKDFNNFDDIFDDEKDDEEIDKDADFNKSLNAEVEEEVHFSEDDSNNGHHNGGVREVDLAKEMRTSFLDYAMSVIVSRAIPDVRDGMKPVHRRILFGMNELGVYCDKPYKKICTYCW